MVRSRGRVLMLVTAGLWLGAVGLGCGGGGSGSPTVPRDSVFGVVGGSLSRFAVQGYIDIGGGRSWQASGLIEYGGGHIAAWAGEIGNPSSEYWGIFTRTLASEPGTEEIWWNILVTDRNDPAPVVLLPADRAMVLDVAAEVRRLAGPNAPLIVSPMPEFDPATGCTVIGSAGVEVSRLMVDFAVAQGLATRGPDLKPITPQTYNGANDPCHQGPLGREMHGRDLLGFFGG